MNKQKTNASQFWPLIRLSCLLLIAAGLLLLQPASVGAETTLPPGFTYEVVVTGLKTPTAIAWAPDGRMFIAQKDGRVGVFQDGKLLPRDFIDISDQVNDYFDRGLLGIAVHPDFPASPYVYLLFTFDPPGVVKDGNGERVSRLIRVSADPNNLNVALPDSELVLLGKNSTRENIGAEDMKDGTTESGVSGPPSCDNTGQPVEDCLPTDGHTHTIGAVLFGKDGALFVSNGEGAETQYVDPRALRAQDLDSLAGKVLRIDPTTGKGLPDNPFYDGNPDHNRSKVWSYGMRNPFRFALHPVTGEPVIADVGWGSWEEVNTGQGKNFGWPCYEGNDNLSLKQPGYQEYPLTAAVCAELYAKGRDAVQAPAYAYFHENFGAAIIGGDFYRGTSYPTQYRGGFFFSDFYYDYLRYLIFDSNGKATVHDFGADMSPEGFPVQIVSGPDTDLYYVLLGGEVRRIRYVGEGTRAPTTQTSTVAPTPTPSPAKSLTLTATALPTQAVTLAGTQLQTDPPGTATQTATSSSSSPAAPTGQSGFPPLVATPTLPPPADNDDLVSFDDLGLSENILRGPFGTYKFSFNLPADWELKDGAELHLDMLVLSSNLGATLTPGVSPGLGGTLDVVFNNRLITTLFLEQNGEHSVTIPIPRSALSPVRADGRQEIALNLSTHTDCNEPQQTSVVVHSTSLFVFPHQTTTPVLDLRRLPQPIYQDTYGVDRALIVIPDKPTQLELQAALAVSAGFGEMTHSNLALSMIRASELDSNARNLNHLIFIGIPQSLPMLEEVGLSIPVESGRFMATEAASDDGIIQLASSPWNNSKVVLVVGSNSDVGVLKAAQAVSTGIIRVGSDPKLAVVPLVRPTEPLAAVPVDQTFSDLGYEDQTSLNSSQRQEYLFYVPPGQSAQAPAYFDLIFSHSTLLNYGQSGVVVNLNGQPIGSVRLSDETATRGNLRLTLPPSAIQPGTNRLTFVADLVPDSECIDPRSNRLWLTIRADSQLHVPLALATDTVAPVFDLKKYPEPFIFSNSLNTLAFVLASDDPASWKVASQIAFDLGDETGLEIGEAIVVFGDNVPDEIRQSRHLLIVGRPSQLPIIAELGQALPAPFEGDNNIAVERNNPVVYNLPSETGIGYIQLLTAPWDKTRVIVAVLGNTDQGLQWAGTVLATGSLRNKISGNLVVINSEQLISSDNRTNEAIGNQAATEQAFAALLTPEPGNVPSSANISTWLTPLIAVLAVLLTITVIGAAVASARRKGGSNN